MAAAKKASPAARKTASHMIKLLFRKLYLDGRSYGFDMIWIKRIYKSHINPARSANCGFSMFL
jgi:hypothetical protein